MASRKAHRGLQAAALWLEKFMPAAVQLFAEWPDFRKIPCYSPPAVRARSGSYSHLSPRFAPGSGGVEPCVRISLRFQWQGGAPGAGRASLDSRVRILSGQPSGSVSGLIFPGWRQPPISPRVRPMRPQSLAGNYWHFGPLGAGLERRSLLAIFQFPFWHNGDRFDLSQRLVLMGSEGSGSIRGLYPFLWLLTAPRSVHHDRRSCRTCPIDLDLMSIACGACS
jgi:hypothetical protein